MIHFCFITGLYSRYDVLMFERQGKSLVAAGYKVTYIVCDGLPNEERDGIEIISTSFKPRNRFERFLKTKKYLLKIAKAVNADIYQISDPELIGMVSDLRKLKKHVIFNLREYYPDMVANKNYIPKLLRPLAVRYYSTLMKIYLRKYDAVFTVTDWVLEKIQKEFGILNSYLLTNFPIVRKDFNLSEQEYMKRPNTLFYEGTIYSSSRQENVFAALDKIGSVDYIIAGKFDEGYNWITELNYWKKVKFVNGFKYEELPELFNRATISNVFRDFGERDGSLGVLKVFESMEAALPVLFADVPLYRKINDKYHCGICVDPNSIDSIEAAIRYLVENKQEAYEMGQNGRRAVIEEFSWDSQEKNYLDVIHQIAN